jgi:hypothetical protein
MTLPVFLSCGGTRKPVRRRLRPFGSMTSSPSHVTSASIGQPLSRQSGKSSAIPRGFMTGTRERVVADLGALLEHEDGLVREALLLQEALEMDRAREVRRTRLRRGGRRPGARRARRPFGVQRVLGIGGHRRGRDSSNEPPKNPPGAGVRSADSMDAMRTRSPSSSPASPQLSSPAPSRPPRGVRRTLHAREARPDLGLGEIRTWVARFP